MSEQKNIVMDLYEKVDGTRTGNINTKELADVQSLMDKGRGDRFLDIGCYDGSKTEIFAEYIGATTVCGVDFLKNRLEMARERGIDAQFADINSGIPLNYADGSFDFIYCGDVIEHIYDPDFLVQEIYRLLAPDGYAIIRTPNLASWRNRIMLLLGYQPFFTEVSTQMRFGNPRMSPGKPSGHLRVFTARALDELTAHYGFCKRQIKTVSIGIAAPDLIGKISYWIDGLLDSSRFLLCDELLIKIEKCP